MQWNALREEVFYSLMILFRNSLLIVNETFTGAEGRHHQNENNIDGKIIRKLVNGPCTHYTVLIQFRIGWLFRHDFLWFTSNQICKGKDMYNQDRLI